MVGTLATGRRTPLGRRRRSLHELVAGLRAVEITVEAAAVRNVNTPAELSEAEALLGTLAP